MVSKMYQMFSAREIENLVRQSSARDAAAKPQALNTTAILKLDRSS